MDWNKEMKQHQGNGQGLGKKSKIVIDQQDKQNNINWPNIQNVSLIQSNKLNINNNNNNKY